MERLALKTAFARAGSLLLLQRSGRRRRRLARQRRSAGADVGLQLRHVGLHGATAVAAQVGCEARAVQGGAGSGTGAAQLLP